jgi:hypothetical protein
MVATSEEVIEYAKTEDKLIPLFTLLKRKVVGLTLQDVMDNVKERTEFYAQAKRTNFSLRGSCNASHSKAVMVSKCFDILKTFKAESLSPFDQQLLSLALKQRNMATTLNMLSCIGKSPSEKLKPAINAYESTMVWIHRKDSLLEVEFTSTDIVSTFQGVVKNIPYSEFPKNLLTMDRKLHR